MSKQTSKPSAPDARRPALPDEKRIGEILSAAHERSDRVLLETEGFALLIALGLNTPLFVTVRNAREADKSNFFPTSDKVVVKVVSPEILHKSDVGGVAIVKNDRDVVVAAIADMERRLHDKNIAGFTINEFVPYDATLGGELLLGLRRTEDFGPVVTVGAGGVYAEFLANNFKTGRDVAILSSEFSGTELSGFSGQVEDDSAPSSIADVLSDLPLVQLITNPPRGQKARLCLNQLVTATGRLLWLGRQFGHLISDFEINPLVIANENLVALDVLVKLGSVPQPVNNHRPVGKIKNLLEPRSAAVIGVSEKLNPGHVIVNNLLREGFDRQRLYIVKPGMKMLEGCRCYADVASLPERVDLLVLSVAAALVPETIAQVIESRKAESIVVIPGGLEEKSGTQEITSRLHAALRLSRATDWRGPVINGGNCLGIRSRPGRYDTMFIPQYKLSTMTDDTPVSPVAVISQSGAFGLAKADKLQRINAKYNITLGNQIDLTVGDYLEYLKDDDEIEVFAVYVEGFARLDGIKFLKAAREITAAGKTVVLYRAGRTVAGAKASSSHTASIAGDYTVTRALSRQAGVVVAETIADFEDLIRMFTFLRGKRFTGRRLGAISNAGFECVAMADNLGSFTLPAFTGQTLQHLREVLQRARVDQVVDAHNPFDLTPMADDLAYEQAVKTVLLDGNVDLGIVGCVPMTPALNTLARGPNHHEDNAREESLVQRLIRLRDSIEKPWVCVVDAGGLYDAMAEQLKCAGIPTFRTADRALRLLNVVCASRGFAQKVVGSALCPKVFLEKSNQL